MKRKTLSLILVLAMMLALTAAVSGISAPTQTARPTASRVLVNGVDTAFDAYNIDGSNYFKLRDLAYVLNGTAKQFNVGWDGAANAISLTSGEAYEPVGGEMAQSESSERRPAAPTASAIYLDGELAEFTAYLIGGNNYFKLRDIMQIFDVYVGWDDATSTITLDTSMGYGDEEPAFSNQAIEDFLSPYISLFSLGVYNNGVMTGWNGASLDRDPLVYLSYDGGETSNWISGSAYYKDGSLVPDDAPFLQDKFIALSFELYDIDSDGIPEILILFAAETYGFAGLYKYIDGQYQNVGFMSWPEFYADDAGRILMVEYDHGDVRVSSVTVTQNGLDINLMADWFYYEDLDYDFVSDDMRVEPLTDLRDEISSAVSEKLE